MKAGTPNAEERVRAAVAYACVALSVIFLVCLLTASRAAAVVSPSDVQGYASEVGVPYETALATLETQESGAGVVEQLESELGDRYAGVWFDDDDREFVVPLLGGVSGTEVARGLAAEKLGDDFRFGHATSSWKDLVAAQARVNRVLDGLLSRGEIQTSLDPRTNSVVIKEVQGLDPAERGAIKRAAAAQGTSVEVAPTNAPSLQIELETCKASPYSICDRPIRGGVRIQQAGSPFGTQLGCTAGFKGTGDLLGNHFILTAGHCYAHGFYEWTGYSADEANRYLGWVQAANYPGQDNAAINASGVNGAEYWSSAWGPNIIANWGVDQEYPINNESSSYVGEGAVCHLGGQSGKSCGTVQGMQISAGNQWGEVNNNLTKFQVVCGIDGDSGGPVFSGNVALGIYVGSDDLGTPNEYCNTAGYYTEITEDTDSLGVHVAPRLSPPSPPPPAEKPSVETTPATAIQENQVTLNGKANPHGSSTTYRFEYGKTTQYGESVPVPEGSLGAGTSSVTATNTISVLPRTRYHYRMVAINAGGATFGADQAFTTGVKWSARNANAGGGPELTFWFGLPGETRVSGDWDGNGTSTPGVYNPTTGVWKLRNSSTTGPVDITFQYGGGPWTTPVVGDWDGNGTDTIGVFDPAAGNWNLRDFNSAGNPNYSFQYGGGPWTGAVAGDWDGNGTTTIGVYDPSTGNWNLRNFNSAGNANYSFQYGGGPWTKALAGDWDGNGTDTIGVFDPTAGNWNLRNFNSAGNANYSFQYGGSQYQVLVGDWDGNGTDTPVISHANAPTAIDWHLRNANSAGSPELSFESGSPEQEPITGDWNADAMTTTGRYEPLTGIWRLRPSNSVGIFTATEFQYSGSQQSRPVVGDWDGNGTDTVGLYEPISGYWRLRNSNSAGDPNLSFQYGGSQYKPVVGDWDGNKTETVGLVTW
jgi:hypothetical protein